MNAQVQITHEGDYIVVRTEGEDNHQSIVGLWQAAAMACGDYNCKKVLGISKMAGMTMLEAYRHFEILTDVGIDRDYRIAWVKENPEELEKLKVVETVLASRGFYQARVFSNVSEAKQWLLE